MGDIIRINSAKQAGVTLAADYEYGTLMRLLGVSVSKHLLDEHFTVVWANDYYYRLIGWTEAEYEELFHNQPDLYYSYFKDEADWKLLVQTVENAFATHQNGYNLVAPIRQKDGQKICVKFSVAFSEDYINGYQVAYSVLTNIDDFVRIQKEQSVTYDNLPGFVAKYRIDADFQLTLLDGNTRFLEYFGNPGSKSTVSLNAQNIAENAGVLTEFKEKLQAGNSAQFVIHVLDKDSNPLWLQVNASCIEWQEEHPVYLVIFIDITDVTELRQMHRKLKDQADALENALAAAENANHAKSDFLSRMSHDIRTPMNAIMGMTSIATSHIDDKDRVLDCLKKIDTSSGLLLSLINEVLDMSKIENNRISMAAEEFNLDDILHNIIAIIQPSILEKHHVFDIHAYGIKHELVIGDPKRIEQVFLNLLSNAIKYTPDCGQIILEISEKMSGLDGYGYYEFVFKDNGYGMKPEFLEKIFTPFERADDPIIHSIQGTGLGMSISRNIVHMMGGEIKVESTYGSGSKFTVDLYLKLQKQENTSTLLSIPSPVLVVDDDQIACETTCERLKELGLSSQWVLSGEEAVAEAVAARKINQDFFAAIIDLKMPGMDGIETSQKIRMTLGGELPIILISSYDWTDYEAAALAAGVNGFVSKPMLKSSLLYAIKRYALKESVTTVHAFEHRKRSFTGRRLLLVEDNELNREIATELLMQTGAVVETAKNGLDAVKKFNAVPNEYYSLIFMDIQMPIMNGIEAAGRIRALDKKDAKSIPIVAMTANVFAEDITAALAAGMNAHLSKPLDVNLLDQVMKQFLK